MEPARGHDIVVLWGLGTGRKARALLRAGAQVEVLAIDVDPAAPQDAERIVGECELLTAARASGRLQLVVAAANDLAARMRAHEPPCRMEVDLAALARVPDRARHLARTIERIHFEQADARRYGPQLRANLRANVEAMIDATNLDAWANAAAGRPGFVLAAGPSAAAATTWLADARRHGPLLAVDTALPLCRTAGLPIDCLVSVDPHPTSAVHLQHGVGGVDVLAFQPYCAPEIVAAFPRRVLALPQGDRLCDRAASLLGLASVPIAGTVLLYALQVAATLGCDPIVLVGADFAHVGGRSHALGTATSRAIDPSGLEVATADGSQVPTSHALLRFLAAIERHIATASSRHVVVDGGGAAIAGARRISPAAIARAVRREPTSPRGPLPPPPAVRPSAIASRRAVLARLLGEFD